MSHSFVGQSLSGLVFWFLCTGSHKAKIKVPDSYLQALEEDPLRVSFKLLQNSVPCNCRADIPTSLLAVSQGASHLLEASAFALT